MRLFWTILLTLVLALGVYTTCAAPGTWDVRVTAPGYETAMGTATLYGGYADMWYHYRLTPRR